MKKGCYIAVLLTRDYCGGHIWRDDTLERVMTDYGYFDGAGSYHAYVKDHQGNVRADVSPSNVEEIYNKLNNNEAD